MKSSSIFTCIILMGMFIGSLPIFAQSDPYARYLRILLEYFEGEFDNDSQIWLEGRRDWKGNPEEKHQRLHISHTRILHDQVGAHAFYVEEFLEDDSQNISRQRVVSFMSDPEAGGIRMKIFFLKDAAKYAGAQYKTELLDGLTQEELFRIETCDLIFQRQGEQYQGSMEDKACQFGEGAEKRYAVHDMIISKDQYWRVDRSFLVKDDSFHKGHPNDEPYKLRRATYYNCNVSFHEKAYYIPSEKDKRYTDIKIHNQGGMHWFENPINGKKYAVQLREKEYPFYTEGSDFFMMRFKEEGKLASEVIVTTAPHASSISFQIGWASAQCKLP
ncbi:MAG: chromophore lyase CpcT/CpeT [Bacteroidota bacterium]